MKLLTDEGFFMPFGVQIHEVEIDRSRLEPLLIQVRDQVRRRSADPLPHTRFGKYVRFRWGSPELEAWANRRIVGSNNNRTGRPHPKETIQ